MSSGEATTACIVCGSPRVSTAGRIAVSDVVKGYRRRFGLDVSGQFAGLRSLTELNCPDCDLRWFWPLVTGNEAFYRELAGRAWYYMHEKPEFAIARRFIDPADVVLEVGAGRGAFAAQCTGGYVGLEFSPAAVEQARQSGVNVIAEPVETHAAAHPGTYDLCCAFQVLEHVADPRGFVHNMAAAAKPGGRVIVSVPSEQGLPGRTINDFLNLPPHHVTRWTDKALAALARSAGLSIEAIEHEPVAAYHLGWHLALRLYGRLAPRLIAGPGNRVRMGFADYATWRVLWLLGGISARVLRPRPAGAGEGHTVVAVMRKD
jgi:SAM-dependent methyltransferase